MIGTTQADESTPYDDLDRETLLVVIRQQQQRIERLEGDVQALRDRLAEQSKPAPAEVEPTPAGPDWFVQVISTEQPEITPFDEARDREAADVADAPSRERRMIRLRVRQLEREARRVVNKRLVRAHAEGEPVTLVMDQGTADRLENGRDYGVDGRLRNVAGLHVIDVVAVHAVEEDGPPAAPVDEAPTATPTDVPGPPDDW
ncbi:MAG: hypothetical protein WD151_15185 [Phycisphaeraceae bacterium]